MSRAWPGPFYLHEWHGCGDESCVGVGGEEGPAQHEQGARPDDTITIRGRDRHGTRQEKGTVSSSTSSPLSRSLSPPPPPPFSHQLPPTYPQWMTFLEIFESTLPADASVVQIFSHSVVAAATTAAPPISRMSCGSIPFPAGTAGGSDSDSSVPGWRLASDSTRASFPPPPAPLLVM